MFANTRAINGVITLLALFFGYHLLGMVSISTTALQAFVFCAFVVVLFICDCILRKKETHRDVGFALVWTLFYAFTSWVGIKRFQSTPEELALLHSILVATFSVLPLIANLIYLALLPKKREPAV